MHVPAGAPTQVPLAHSKSAVHGSLFAVLQVPAPSQLIVPMQAMGRSSDPRAGMGRHWPSLPATPVLASEQASQGMSHTFMQQTPSAQELLTHWFAVRQASPVMTWGTHIPVSQ